MTVRSLIPFIPFYFSGLFGQALPHSAHHGNSRDTTYMVRINRTIPEFIAHFKMTKLPPDDKIQYLIELRNSTDSSLFLSIIDTVDFCWGAHIDLIDINLDGYLDVKLVSGESPAYADQSYRFWIFDQKKHRYLHNEEFSNIYGQFVIDSLRKTITCTFRDNCSMCTTQDVYKLSSNHLRLVEHQWDERIGEDENGVMTVKTTIERLIEGKMTVVKTILPK